MTKITEHKWSDSMVSFVGIDETERRIRINITEDEYNWTQGTLDKSDAIAIAKHFNLIQDGTKTVILKPGESAMLLNENGERASVNWQEDL